MCSVQCGSLNRFASNITTDVEKLKFRYLLFKHCNLEMIEEKTLKGAYKTLRDFHSDAACLEHDVHIWFGG